MITGEFTKYPFHSQNTYHCCTISTCCHSVLGCYATNLDTDAFTCNHFKSLNNNHFKSLNNKSLLGLWPKYRNQQFLSTVLSLPLHFLCLYIYIYRYKYIKPAMADSAQRKEQINIRIAGADLAFFQGGV